MNKSLISLLAVAILLLPGCGHNVRYQPKPLKPAKTQYTQNSNQPDLSVHAQLLSSYQLASLFNRDISKRLKKNRLEAILLSVRNKGDKNWILSPESISVPLASIDYVHEQLKGSNTGYFFGGLAVGITGIALSSILFPPATVGFILGVPVRTSQLCKETYFANDVLEHDLSQKMLLEELYIANLPVTKLLFVKRELLKPEFNLILENAADPDDLVAFRVTVPIDSYYY